MGSVAVRAHGLTKTFGEGDLAVAAVREVDLDIAKGEVVLVMGPSGSGKTTLLLMLGAMLRPTRGAIEVDGVDLASAAERRLPALRARRFGFVFQDFNLSGGEKQRVAIARALANDPSVILADEPTANLDTSHGREIARLLRRLAVEDGRSVVIVSHDTRLKEIAHRVLWLEDGSFRELAAMAIDPVCQMAVDQTESTPYFRLDGHMWWFCSDACRKEFAATPERFRVGTAQ